MSWLEFLVHKDQEERKETKEALDQEVRRVTLGCRGRRETVVILGLQDLKGRKERKEARVRRGVEVYRDCKDQQVVQECLVQLAREGLMDQRGQKDREDLKVFLDQLGQWVHRDLKETLF